MKQYVLDEPGARVPGPMPAAAAAPPGRWRWPVVLAALVAVGLVAGRSFVESRPEPAARAADAAVVPVYVAPVALEPARKAAVAQPVAAPVETPPSRVTRANGRYIVELHDAAIAPVLAMLGDATRTSVTGSDVVSASPARITTSFVADSPLDAWKGVFGDLASFAMTCGHSGCSVRFVSLVSPTSSTSSTSTSMSISSVPIPPTRPFAPAIAPASPPAPDGSQSGEPAMPDN